MAIVNNSKWEEAMRKETKNETGNKDTPMRKLICKMPGRLDVRLRFTLLLHPTWNGMKYLQLFQYNVLLQDTAYTPVSLKLSD